MLNLWQALAIHLKREAQTFNRRLFLHSLLFTLLCLTQTLTLATAEEAEPPKILHVVLDDDYPPYVFRDAKGAIQGYLVDSWQLWQQKTGVPVDLQATDWSKALESINQQQADVIDTIFFTPERQRYLDFTDPYTTIPVSIFVHQDITGIIDLKTLTGFVVGVKKGDVCIDHLKQSHVNRLEYFDNYQSLINAAVANKIRIFCLDDAPAHFLLYQANQHKNFRQALTLYQGQFHRAVNKGQHKTLELVNQGFAAISGDEYQALQDKWLGRKLIAFPYLEKILYILLFASCIAIFLLIFNLLLRRTIKLRTAELTAERGKLAQLLNHLQVSEHQLRLSENNFRQLFTTSQVSIWHEDFSVVYQQLAMLRTQPVDNLKTYLLDNPEVARQLTDSVIVTDVNPATLLLFGASSKEMFFSGMHNIYASQRVDVCIAQCCAIWEQQTSFRAEMCYQTLNGQVLHLIVSMPVPDNPDDFSCIPVTFLDITAQKNREAHLQQAQEESHRLLEESKQLRKALLSLLEDQNLSQQALVENEMLFRSTFEQAAVGMSHIDLAGHFIRVNQRQCEILGFSAEELLKLSYQELSHPDDLEESYALVQQLLQGECDNFSIEKRYIRKDGAIIWVYLTVALVRTIQNQPDYCIAVIEDISQRKNAEAAVQKSEQRFRQLFELSPIPLALYSAQGEVVYLNASFLQTFGYSTTDLPNLDAWWSLAFPDPEYRLQVINSWSALVQEAIWKHSVIEPHEYHITCKPGNVCITEASGIILDDNVLVTFFDITERKHADATVKELLERLQKLAAHIPGFIYQYRLRTDGSSHFPYASAGIRDIYACTPEEVTEDASKAFALIHPGDSAAIVNSIQSSAASLSPWYAEYRINLPDGQTIWVEGRATPVKNEDQSITWHGYISNITERKFAKEQLVKLSLAVEQNPVGIIITDIHGRIEYVNTAFAQTSGYAQDELIGQNPNQLSSGKTPATTHQKMWQTLLQGEVWHGQFVNRHKDGGEYYVHTQIAPIRQANGEITHYLGIEEDISEKIRVNSELGLYRDHLEDLVEERTLQLEEATRTAEQANKAKSIFLANMSHEIRTPMNAIIGFSDLLQRSPLNADQQHKLSRITASAQHLLNIINDILDISKIEAGKLQLDHIDFDCRQILNTAVELVQHKANEKSLELVVESDLLQNTPLHGDPIRLTQAVLNFASNAVKFTKQGCVILRLRLLEETSSSLALRFEVEDSGIGISQETLPRLFNHFEQADSSTTRHYGGTGLGLSITRHLIELMGGNVGVQSAVGTGSRFWFNVTLQKVTDTNLAAPISIKCMRVLIADNNPASRNALQHMLQQLGLRVVAVASGVIALESMHQAEFSSDPFELVIFKMHMPEMSGFETLAHMLTMTSTPPRLRLLLTPSSNSATETLAIQSGFSAVLKAPVTPIALINTLHLILTEANNLAASKINQSNAEATLLQNYPGRRILLCEDNPVNQEVAIELLNSINLSTDLAENGAIAVEKASLQHYDLVLMDMQMPVMDGIEATRRLRALPGYTTVPILAMTANAFSEDKQLCLNVGMNDHIAKPVCSEMLFDTLLKWLPKPGRPATQPAIIADTGSNDRLVEQLATLPGLDIKVGLSVTRGRAERYVNFLKLFIEHHSLDTNKLKAFIEADNWSAAERVSHSLKGAAGTIGLVNLQKLATGLNLAIREKQSVESITPILTELETRFQALQTAFDHFYNEYSAD